MRRARNRRRRQALSERDRPFELTAVNVKVCAGRVAADQPAPGRGQPAAIVEKPELAAKPTLAPTCNPKKSKPRGTNDFRCPIRGLHLPSTVRDCAAALKSRSRPLRKAIAREVVLVVCCSRRSTPDREGRHARRGPEYPGCFGRRLGLVAGAHGQRRTGTGEEAHAAHRARHSSQAALDWAAAVDEDSSSRIMLQVYPASQSGSIPPQVEGWQFGAIQAAPVPPEFFVGLDPRFEVMAAPGQVNSMQHGQRRHPLGSGPRIGRGRRLFPRLESRSCGAEVSDG